MSRLSRLPSLCPFALLAALAACSSASEPAAGADGGGADAAVRDDAPAAADGPGPGADAAAQADAGPDGPPPCPAGVTCVDTFPFGDDRDTTQEPAGTLDGYSCAPSTNESGPEVVYRVTVPADGFLSAAVIEAAGVDVDVHILGDLDPAACLSRGNYHARADVTAGVYYVVVDTYAGAAQAGAFHVDIGFLAPSAGGCGMQAGAMARVGDGGNHLAMPATGPMVLEAHLVTQEEPPPYPATATDELAAHYALSQSRTGLVMHRTQDWAPLEGGSFYGAGIGSPTDFPVVDEGWYVNMYWTQAARPAKGTRMILRAPGGDRAVVVAAGYETGPGDLTAVGGTPEESHFYMGTGHLDPMLIGIAVDQTLPLGPRRCAP
ncbi:MAG TPA: hypothetical protein VGQ83_04445 [Polyangia bacterium]|jgi:hypothetical protein